MASPILPCLRTLLSAESTFAEHFITTFGGLEASQGQYHLLGVDIILDESLNPMVIEINGLPSMQLSHEKGDKNYNKSYPYTETKLGLTEDVVRLVFQKCSLKAALIKNMSKVFSFVGLDGELDSDMIRYITDMRCEIGDLGGFKLLFPPPRGPVDSTAASAIAAHAASQVASLPALKAMPKAPGGQQWQPPTNLAAMHVVQSVAAEFASQYRRGGGESGIPSSELQKWVDAFNLK